MKKLIITKAFVVCFFITSILCFPSFLSSINGNTYFNTGQLSASESVKIVIEGADRKTVEQEWRKMMRSYGGKVSNKRRVWTSENTEISSISNQAVMVIATIENAKKGVEISVQFRHADANVSLLNDPNVKKAAEKFINEFAVKVKVSATEKVLNQAKKDLKNSEREKDKLIKENKKLENNIKKAEKTVQDSKKDIEKNKNAIKEKESESKKLNDKIKELEREIKKLK